MNIESLLKAVHTKLKPLTDKLAIEGQIFYEDLLQRTEDSKEKDVIAEHLASFKRQAEQLDQSLMSEIQERISELAGDDIDVDSSIFHVTLTADDLELVETEDLEQQVTLETMAAKALGKVGKELNLLNQRLNKGLKKEDIEDKTNPFAPHEFCDAFGKISRKINVPSSQKMTIFRLFELNVLSEIESLLVAANDNLKAQGILPNAEVARRAPQKPVNPAAAKAEEKTDDEAVQPVPLPDGGKDFQLPVQHYQKSGLFDINDPMIKQIYDLLAKEGYHVLEKLLSESGGGDDSRISSDGVGDLHFAGKQELAEDELIQILDSLQAKAKRVDDGAVLEGELQRGHVLDELGGALKEHSASKGVATALSKAGNDKVKLVDMLFDHMMTDNYLPDNVKNIISELQIPLTKLALMDESFFSDQNHPGRLLLNELSRTGMSVNREGIGNDQSIKLISGTVRKVQDNFKTDKNELEDVLVDLSSNLKKQNKKIDVLEKRLMDAEKGKAKTEHAEQLIDELYEKFRARVPMPEAVDEFLDSAWHDVLMMTCLKFGGHSKQWLSDKDVTTKFLKSILMAKRARLDGKQMKIPMELLKILKQGLDRISYDALETKRLLSQLAKAYQTIAATEASDIEKELMEFGGELNAAKKASEHKAKKVAVINVTDESEAPVELSEEEKEKQAQKEKIKQEFEQKIEQEKQKIAESPIQALEEKIKNLDQDFAETPELKEIEPINEFVEGNTWFDLASSLPVGVWVELTQKEGSAPLRCKVVANIKSLNKLIFVNKAGAKVAERQVIELAQELKAQKAKVLNDNTIFDQALEKLIVNLRSN